MIVVPVIKAAFRAAQICAAVENQFLDTLKFCVPVIVIKY